jgi:hypothetical protein
VEKSCYKIKRRFGGSVKKGERIDPKIFLELYLPTHIKVRSCEKIGILKMRHLKSLKNFSRFTSFPLFFHTFSGFNLTCFSNCGDISPPELFASKKFKKGVSPDARVDKLRCIKGLRGERKKFCRKKVVGKKTAFWYGSVGRV